MDQIDIMQLSMAIIDVNTRTLDRFFGSGKMPLAFLLWEPEVADMVFETLRELHSLWRNGLRDAGHGAESLVRESLSLDSQRYLMVVEPDTDYHTVYYRYYGAGIAEYYGHNLTGQSASAFSNPIATFFVAAYRAVGLENRPLLTRHHPPRHVPVKEWHRLILPVTISTGVVACFLVANVPVPRQLRP